MTFKILISTVDDKFLNRAYTPPADFLIINQLINKESSDYSKLNLFSYKEKGLSKSRNRAIEHCNSDIALISDDDVIYVKNIQEILMKAFEENPEADIITFQIKTPEGKFFKNYKYIPFMHNIKSLMKVSSIEIALKVDSIRKNNIKFDENFGLGSRFPTGEEIIFLTDALKKGLKIKFLPITIAYHKKESSGGNFKNNISLIKAKGAMFYRIFGSKGYLISLIFALKKYKLSNYSFFKFYKLMLEGIKEYKGIINDKK
jgi:GT2 family glycosyltransferase